MKTLIPFAIAALLLVVPAGSAASRDVVGEGDILVGSPTTEIASDGAGVTSFYLDVSGFTGESIASQTVDGSGLGYDIDFYFWDASGSYLSGCFSIGSEETGCTVPAAAAEVEVAAWIGANLHVTVVVE